MRTSVLDLVFLLASSGTLMACGQRGGETPPPSTSQPAAEAVASPAIAALKSGSSARTPDGLEISVLGVERVREWQMELMPGMPGPKLEARPGYEIAVMHLGLKSVVPGAKSLDVKSLGIFDAGGQTHRCDVEATDICDLGPQGEATCKLPCTIPENIAIAGVKSGETSVKLESPVPARR